MAGLMSKHWRAGNSIPQRPGDTLMRIPRPGQGLPHGTDNCPVRDLLVNNVAHCQGGLAAHNYWDNTEEFIPVLADAVVHCAAEPGRPRG